MKRLLFSIIFSLLLGSTAISQTVETFTIDDNTYYGIKVMPKEIIGSYKYEKTKEPIVQINSNATGYFQVHGVKPYPVEFWIETDENGVIHKRESDIDNSYQMVLILKYGSNGEVGFRGAMAGSYSRIDVVLNFTEGYAIILGERFKAL